MAIQNARILIRGGNEADFDPDKMQPREWALSTDKKIVRICVAPGVCIRMATYDAFEADMAQIEAILEECRDIQTVVNRINDEVSANAKAVAEYTEQAKQYRDEAEQFRNEAEAFSPEGYSELVQNVEENTVKIDTILEKGGLTFDESASGDTIHRTDTTDNKVTAFALYGKATQESTTGKNLLPNTATTQTSSGIVFTVNNDKSINAKGTPTTRANLHLINSLNLKPNVEYVLSKGFSSDKATLLELVVANNVDSTKRYVNCYRTNEKASFILGDNEYISNAYVSILSDAGEVDVTFYPMIRLATETDATYEPYTNGASPNPDYPQEIEVAGASGSVDVKSVGKNFINQIDTSVNNAMWIYGDVPLVGTTSKGKKVYLPKETYTFSFKSNVEKENSTNLNLYDVNGEKINTFAINTKAGYSEIAFSIDKDAHSLTSYSTIADTFSEIQIEKGNVRTPYEPYKETTATIPTPNGLPGIPVSSGGNYTDENGQQWICDSIVKYADGTGKYVQRVNKVVIDENTGIVKHNLSNEDYFVCFLRDTGLNKTKFCLSSHFSGTFDNGANLGVTSCIYMVVNVSPLHISIPTSIASDVESFRTWAMENNFLVLYELAEPIITDLSAEEIAEIEKLQTFYPVTNISNDSGCGMEIAYKADAKNYIDNIILARVATLETAVINNL